MPCVENKKARKLVPKHSMSASEKNAFTFKYDNSAHNSPRDWGMNRAASRVDYHEFNLLKFVINKDWMKVHRTNGNIYPPKQLCAETSGLELQLKPITFAELEKQLGLDHLTSPGAQLTRFLYPVYQ